MIDQSRPIGLAKAKAEIQQRKGLQKIVINENDSLATKYAHEPGGNKDEGKQFFKHAGNAFLFTKESVLRHFFEEADPSTPTVNTHLMVVLGAHDKDEENFKKSDPTIIIAGVEEGGTSSGATKYTVTSSSSEPADQYPPVENIEDLPKINGDPENVFYIRLI